MTKIKIDLPDIPTALSDEEAAVLIQLASGKRVLEIGSLPGFSTIVLANVAEIVHSVDPHEGYPEIAPKSTLVPFLENLQRYGVRDKVVVHVDTAARVLPAFRRGYFDFAFVDAMGTYEVTKQCILDAYLHTDGYLLVHDYGHPEWPGAKQAIDEFAQRKDWPFRVVDTLAIFEV